MPPPPVFGDSRRTRVGLLGGSFNPAHAGHRHISLLCLKRLGLDEVWWLVSPQNPLKESTGMAPLAARLDSARTIAAGHPRLHVTAIEGTLGTRYTADTLAALRRRFARARFVWIMGADNMAQIPRWRRWADIFHTVPVAIVPRRPYLLSAMIGKAASRFRRARVPESAAFGLPLRSPPAWTLLGGPIHPASATALRARAGTHPQEDRR
jgi:nicotinate-nucleotide adenylyltransferase